MHQGKVVPSPWKLRCQSAGPSFMCDTQLLYSLTHKQTQSCEFRTLARKPESQVLSSDTLWPRRPQEIHECLAPQRSPAEKSRMSVSNPLIPGEL